MARTSYSEREASPSIHPVSRWFRNASEPRRQQAPGGRSHDGPASQGE